jgi:hypothetical protein
MAPTVNTRGSVDEMAMYCGQSVSGIKEIIPAGERVNAFIDQFNAAASMN